MRSTILYALPVLSTLSRNQFYPTKVERFLRINAFSPLLKVYTRYVGRPLRAPVHIKRNNENLIGIWYKPKFQLLKYRVYGIGINRYYLIILIVCFMKENRDNYGRYRICRIYARRALAISSIY